MKKLKRKKGGTGRSPGFLLAHGEKLGMGLVGLCVAWFIYSGMGQEPIKAEMRPDGITGLADRATRKIKERTIDDLPDEKKLTVTDYGQLVTIVTFGPDEYDFVGVINPPEFDPKQKRSDPVLLTAEAIEVSSGAGLIAYQGADERPSVDAKQANGNKKKPKPGREGEEAAEPAARSRYGSDGLASLGKRGARVSSDEHVRVRYWATVLAKVPTMAQERNFIQALRRAEGYDLYRNKNEPIHLGYLVQRAEISGDGDPKWEKAVIVTSKSVDKLIDIWGKGLPDTAELADPNYLHLAFFTSPLPPLVGRDWEVSEVTHSEVPLDSELEPIALEVDQDEASSGEAGEEFDFSVPRGARSRRGRDMGPEMEMEGGRSSIPRRGSPSGGRSRTYRRADAPFQLLRFFDFNVKPGKQYAYRVQLVVADPNHEVELKYLADDVIARRGKKKSSYRKSEWSEPSAVVSIPYPGQIIANSTKPGKYGGEPSAKVLVSMLNVKERMEGNTIVEAMYRGAHANFRKTIKAIDYRDGGGRIRDFEDFIFLTRTTLLDMRGGESFPDGNENFTRPTELLLLDPFGRLVVRGAFGDQSAYQARKDQIPAEKEKRRSASGEDEKRGLFDRGRNSETGNERQPSRGRSRSRS